MTFRPDPTFYPSPRLALQGPAKRFLAEFLELLFVRTDSARVPGFRTYGSAC